MKRNKIYWIGLSLLTVFFVSCLDKETGEIKLSSDPTFVSLTFAENDSIPGLEDAVFTLEYEGHYNDSIIVNLDSLPHLTRIDSVYATFTFKSTSGSYLVQDKADGSGQDTIYFASSDTIDFTLPTVVYNRSSDGTALRSYRIKVNVHQVEPELYVWKELNPQVTTYPEINQKAIYFEPQDLFLFYVGSDTETKVYESADKGVTWTAGARLNLPAENTASLKLRYMAAYKNQLYVTDNAGKLYRSGDGKMWETAYANADTLIYNLLFPQGDALWGIMRTGNDAFCLGMTADGSHWEYKADLPQYWNDADRMFPIDDYASLVFKSRVGNPKMMVLGGLNKRGLRNRTTWVSENGVAWEPLRDGALPALQGMALTQYDDKLLLFGGMGSSGYVTPLLESKNEGLSWSVPDSAYNVLPEKYPARTYQSVILDESDKRLYLVGGKNMERIYSDVWTVKLNRMYFGD